MKKNEISIADVPSLHISQPISKVINLFMEKSDVVLVIDDKNRFEGIIRVHDVVGKGKNPATLCKSIMSRNIPTILQEELKEISPLEMGEMMIDGATRFVPVLDTNLRTAGAIKDIDLLPFIYQKKQNKEILVKDATNWEITTLSITDNIGNAIAKMREFGYSKIPILNEKGKIEGIINNRSLLRPYPEKRATSGDLGGDRDKDWHLLPVSDFIQPVDIISGDSSIEDALDKFTSENKNFFIVIQNKVMGILTPLDIIQYYSNQKKVTGFNIFIQQAPDDDIKEHTIRKSLTILEREESWIGNNCHLHVRFKRNLSQSKRGQFSITATIKMRSDKGLSFNTEATDFGAEKAVNTALDSLARIISESKKKKLAQRDRSPGRRKFIESS